MGKHQNASTGEVVGDDAPTGTELSMHLKIHSPFKVYFDGRARSVSASNETGPFDILPHHHNFITLLNSTDIVVRPLQGKPETIHISGGIMHVKHDDVVVFLDV